MTETDRRTQLSPFRLVGFNIFFSMSIRDEDAHDIILLDMIGPLQAIRGIWAALKQKKHNVYALGGMCKLQKDPGHYVIKDTLPSGYTNWTFVSRQAIPRLIKDDLPTFVWYKNKELDRSKATYEIIKTPPQNFMPMFEAAAPFPVRPDWANELWKIGRDMNCIRSMSYRDVTNIMAFKIVMNRERWELKITEAIKAGTIGYKQPDTVNI